MNGNRNEIDRRDFFRSGSTLLAGAAAIHTTPADAEAAKAAAAQTAKSSGDHPAGATVLPYGRKLVAQAQSLREGVPLPFTFPDAASPCVLIKNGRPVPGGVGPQGDIAAFSTLCTHMGCPTAYDAKQRIFRCPCHFSLFDAELGGQLICGQATIDLPEIVLEYDAGSDALSAVGVRGLIYGRSANVL